MHEIIAGICRVVCQSGRPSPSGDLLCAQDHVSKKTRDLRKQVNVCAYVAHVDTRQLYTVTSWLIARNARLQISLPYVEWDIKHWSLWLVFTTGLTF